VIDAPGLRPTLDRFRETLFNWLMFDIHGRRTLDAYAGTGVLGFEALSRGARSVVFLEQSAAAFRQLNDSAQKLPIQPGTTTLIHTDTLRYLQDQPVTPFDLVFLDPPFGKQLITQTCERLSQRGWLADGALIYLECDPEGQPDPLPAGWQMRKEKHTRNKWFSLWCFEGAKLQ
jgi:16S rRNA (guanine966-N2)-methyltransferase